LNSRTPRLRHSLPPPPPAPTNPPLLSRDRPARRPRRALKPNPKSSGSNNERAVIVVSKIREDAPLRLWPALWTGEDKLSSPMPRSMWILALKQRRSSLGQWKKHNKQFTKYDGNNFVPD